MDVDWGASPEPNLSPEVAVIALKVEKDLLAVGSDVRDVIDLNRELVSLPDDAGQGVIDELTATDVLGEDIDIVRVDQLQ